MTQAHLEQQLNKLGNDKHKVPELMQDLISKHQINIPDADKMSSDPYADNYSIFATIKESASLSQDDFTDLSANLRMDKTFYPKGPNEDANAAGDAMYDCISDLASGRGNRPKR